MDKRVARHKSRIEAWRRDIAQPFQDRILTVIAGATDQTKTDIEGIFGDIRVARYSRELPRLAAKAFDLADKIKGQFWQSKPDLQSAAWLKRLAVETVIHSKLLNKGIRWQEGNDQQIDQDWMKTPFAELSGTQKFTAAAARFIDRQRGKYDGTSFKEYATHIHRLWIANNPKEARSLGLSLTNDGPMSKDDREAYNASLRQFANVKFIA